MTKPQPAAPTGLADLAATVLSPTERADSPDEVELAYPNSAQWLERYLLPNYVRRPVENRWCPTWWEHAEALTRIEALWRSWEALRWDGPTGMAVWWRDYCDPHMRVLLSADGPFFDCVRGHTLPTPFTVLPPPQGMF